MKTPSIDTDLPALVIEIIADSVTPDPAKAAALCDRARRHWRERKGFRKSFSRRDERAQMKVWMEHWLAGRTHPLTP